MTTTTEILFELVTKVTSKLTGRIELFEKRPTELDAELLERFVKVVKQGCTAEELGVPNALFQMIYADFKGINEEGLIPYFMALHEMLQHLRSYVYIVNDFTTQ